MLEVFLSFFTLPTVLLSFYSFRILATCKAAKEHFQREHKELRQELIRGASQVNPKLDLVEELPDTVHCYDLGDFRRKQDRIGVEEGKQWKASK